MYTGLIFTDDSRLWHEAKEVAGEFSAITLRKGDTQDLQGINPHNLLFIIISDMSFLQGPLGEFLNQQVLIPDVIFYNHTLSLETSRFLQTSGSLRLLVGENRKQNLKQTIAAIQSNHWRRIPFDQLGIDVSRLSQRMKQVFQLIETCDISQINSQYIAGALSISPGYFSQAFKKEVGISFRQFRQKLLNLYEEIIVSRYDVPTHIISRLLGYSELASFSRSFKRRQGISPTQFRKRKQLV